MITSRRTILIAIFLLTLIFQSAPARLSAAQCSGKTCVDVYIESGQIIIEGRKGSGKKSTVSNQRKVIAAKPTKKPASQKPTPTPKATTTRRTPIYVAPPKKVIVKVAPKEISRKVVRKVLRKITPAISINDKLVRLLPSGLIAKQPAKHALVNVPVIYWCDLPTVFTTQVAVVGEIIDVTMRPSFLWSFGDGTFLATTEPGGPYPRERITHTYSHAGTYLVTMLATWGGTWSHNGVARAITGRIRKLSVTTLAVESGSTRFTR